MKKTNIILSLLLLGILISIYLTYVHYYPGALVCPDKGVVNCTSVITSNYSVVFGVPLAIYSLIWFVVAFLLVRAKKAIFLTRIWLLIGIGGMVYSIFSMYQLREICIYCLSLDILIVLSLALFFTQRD
jgi:uncharacterized membrane protein